MDLDNELLDLHPIPPEAEELIRSDWADRVAYGIAGQDTEWHNYTKDLAQEARLTMWKAAENWNGYGDVTGLMKQRGRWRIIGIVTNTHTFTGAEKGRVAGRHTQKRGDERREAVRLEIQRFAQAYGREPNGVELGAALGISSQIANDYKRQLKELAGGLEGKPKLSSLETLLEEAASEEVLGDDQHLEGAMLAYHYNEIHESLSELTDKQREYVWLRFWEGWSESEIRKSGNRSHWDRIKPVLAEKLGHLIGAT